MFKKHIFSVILFILLISVSLGEGREVFINLDAPVIKSMGVNDTLSSCSIKKELPRNWRMSSDTLKITSNTPIPLREGLDILNISGSGAFTAEQLEKMKETFGDRKVVIVDLREESHLYVNNLCLSWYKVGNNMNVGKNLDEITEIEKGLLKKLKDDGEVKVDNILKRPDLKDSSTWEINQIPVKVETVMTEQEMVGKYGLGYYRVPVSDYHRPEDDDVDNFIAFYKNLPDDTWLHFHCKAGKGRTTTFMIMYDMMRNYDKATAEDIINRQWLLGGINLFDIYNTDNFKIEWSAARKEFVFAFYQYCKENGPDYKTIWSKWLTEKKGEMK